MQDNQNCEIIGQFLVTTNLIDTNYTFLGSAKKIRLVDSLTTMIAIIRKKINELSKETVEENRNLYTELNNYYKVLIVGIEGGKGQQNNLLLIIEDGYSNLVLNALRNIQHSVYSISKILILLQRSSFSNIGILTNLLFQISELNIKNADEKIEDIINKFEIIISSKEKITKLTTIRTILEKILLLLLFKEELDNKKGFFMNLKICKDEKIFTKKTCESLGNNYSLLSKFVHGEDEINISDYKYAMNIAIESIKLILNSLQKKTKKVTEER